MKQKTKTIFIVSALVLMVLLGTGVAAAQGTYQDDLVPLRMLTLPYFAPEAAVADGWGLVDGLDHCFTNPGVGDMGYHYINTGWLDTNVQKDQPEALVYYPMKNGGLKLGAVEYIVPAVPWDEEEHLDLPQLYGQSFHLNEALGVYVLHVWIWRHNPWGIFEDWNPKVSCALE